MFTTQLYRVFVCVSLLGSLGAQTTATTEDSDHKPTILHEPRDQIYVVGDGDRTSINLRCYVISYQPKYTVTWYKNGLKLNTDPEKYITQQHNKALFILAIEGVTVDTAEIDSGYYQCVIHEHNTAVVRGRKARIDIRVLSAGDTYPVCLKNGWLQEDISLTPGQTLLFTCVSLLTGQLALEWNRGKQGQLSSEIRTDGVFLYEDLERTVSTEDDGAVYTCSQPPNKKCTVGPLSVYDRHKNESVSRPSVISKRTITTIVIFVHVFFVVFVLIPCLVFLVLRLKRRNVKQYGKSMIVRRTYDAARTRGSPCRGMTPPITSVSGKVASQEQFWKPYSVGGCQTIEEETKTSDVNSDGGDYVVSDIQYTWDFGSYQSLTKPGDHEGGDYVTFDDTHETDDHNYQTLIKEDIYEDDETTKL